MFRLARASTRLCSRNKLPFNQYVQGVRNFRVNPLIYEHIDEYWYLEDHYQQYLREFKEVEPKNVKPKEAKVQVSKFLFEGKDIALVTFETVNSNVNVCSLDLLQKILEAFRSPVAQECSAIILRSAKPGQFIADDDLEYINSMTPQAYNIYSKIYNQLLGYFIQDHKNVLMIVDGPCMNGGLELLLTAWKVMAYDHPNVKFGFNCVKKGYSPDTFSLYRFHSYGVPSKVLGTFLTGEPLSVQEVFRLMLVRELLSIDDYKSEFEKFVVERRIADSHKIALRCLLEERTRDEKILKMYYANLRFVMYRFMNKVVCRVKYLTLFPTLVFIPYILRLLLIEFKNKRRIEKSQLWLLYHWLVFLKNSYNIDMHRKHAIKAGTKVAQKLFYLKDSLILRKLEVRRAGFMNKIPPIIQNTLPYQNVGVVGMNDLSTYLVCSNIIKNAARAKLSLYDPSEEALSKVHSATNMALNEYQTKNYEYYTKDSQIDLIEAMSPPISQLQPSAAFDRYNSVVKSVERLSNCDILLVNPPRKNEIESNSLTELDKTFQGKMIGVLTSFDPLNKLTENCSNKKKIIGINFSLFPFHSSLIEVIPLPETSPETLDLAMKMARAHEKNCIVVKDSPGFFSSRIFCAGLSEVLGMIKKGSTPSSVDNALKSIGFEYGFSSFVDYAGVDKVLETMKYLKSSLNLEADLSLLEHLCNSSALGLKSKGGIYSYNSTNPYQFKPIYSGYSPQFSSYFKQIPYFKRQFEFITPNVDRVLFRIVNESIKCLEEGVVTSPEAVDVAAVYGIGFPSTLGGPCQYVDTLTPQVVLKKLNELHVSTGSACFIPCNLLQKMASSNEKFFKDK